RVARAAGAWYHRQRGRMVLGRRALRERRRDADQWAPSSFSGRQPRGRGSFPRGCTRGWSDRQRRSGRTCLPSGLLRSIRSRPRRQQRRGRLSRACRAVGAVGRLSLVAMAKTYRLNLGTRLVNALFRALTRLGLGARYRYILVVPGRKTGRLYSTPVDVIRADGERW